MGLIEDFVLAHELEHALADQNFGLPDDDSETAQGDAGLAMSSLVEGDAMLMAGMYMVSSYRGAGTDAFGEAARLASAFGNNADPLTRILAFPYLEGTLYVCELFAEGLARSEQGI